MKTVQTKRELQERIEVLEWEKANGVTRRIVMIGRLKNLEREVSQLKRDQAELLAMVKRLAEDNAALHDLRASQVHTLGKRVDRAESALPAARKLRNVVA